MRMLISGGGVAGLTLAYWLHRYGFEPVVIEKTPQVEISVGRCYIRALPRRLPPEEAESKVIAYARQHPHLIRYLLRLLGYRTDGTDEDLRALARLGIVVAFEPITSMKSGQE